MKGDVGMSLHEKEGNKKMTRPRQEIIDDPIPTSLFFNSVHVSHLQVFLNCIPSTCKQQNSCIAHVGIGLSMISFLGLGIFLFPSFSWSDIPTSPFISEKWFFHLLYLLIIFLLLAKHHPELESYLIISLKRPLLLSHIVWTPLSFQSWCSPVPSSYQVT